MRCSQCEEAESTVRCVDEDLHFCGYCSAQLHMKKARQHHEIEPIRAVLICDECEDTSAEVECFECGGRGSAMAFCLACSASLHSRAARAGHQICIISRLKKQGREKSVGGRITIDLSDFDSEEENQITVKQQNEDVTGAAVFAKTRVKEEARPCSFASKVSGQAIDDRDTSDLNTMERRKQFAPPQAKVGKQTKTPGLIKLENNRSPVKRKRTLQANFMTKNLNSSGRRSTSSGSENDDGDEEFGGVHRIKRGSVSLEAFVVDAGDQDDAGPTGASPECKVEAGIKKRIKNMLELGLHPDTPEFEAQQALKNAQRMLTKHNLKQAEVLNGNLRDTSSLIGGMRVVELRAKGKTHGRMDAWVKELGWVIGDNFDCQYYFNAGSPSKPLRVVFYGISQNADCAGYAFAATFNRITTMSAAYVAKKAFDVDKENEDVKAPKFNCGTYTRVARTNYRKGIVAGLKAAVRSAKRMRKESVSKYERELPAANEADEYVCESGGEDNFSTLSGPNSKGEDGVDDNSTATRVAETCMAITALVIHSQKVGEEFLKQQGIKLRKRSTQHRFAAWNEEAFVEGKKDSAIIDINQKSLTSAKVKKSRNSGM